MVIVKKLQKNINQNEIFLSFYKEKNIDKCCGYQAIYDK